MLIGGRVDHPKNLKGLEKSGIVLRGSRLYGRSMGLANCRKIAPPPQKKKQNKKERASAFRSALKPGFVLACFKDTLGKPSKE